jgi:lysine-N-methylase
MPALLLDPEQRFTCRQCGRCCRRGWDIALTPGEVDAYRKAGVARFFRASLEQAEGSEPEPWEPIPGYAPHLRLRKRADGACGFLSPENRCRLHEELGADRKPLTCRLFPFRFHPTGAPPVATASFCCPTVIANDGAPLATQAQELRSLAQDWFRAYPEPANDVLLVGRRLLAAAQLKTVRGVLRELLERKNAEGPLDLRANVARMARWLEDLTRYRVTRLDEAAFEEYLAVMGRYAVSDPKPPPPRPPSRLGRLDFRGFLFTVLAASERLGNRSAGLRLGLRLKVFRLLLHAHGLGPAVGPVRLGAARKSPVDLADPALWGLVHHYLRAAIETLGTGRRPVLDELAVAVAFLNAAFVLARMRAAAEGRAEVDLATLSQGLMEAADLTHADPGTALGRRLTSFAGGVESLYLFASDRLL